MVVQFYGSVYGYNVDYLVDINLSHYQEEGLILGLSKVRSSNGNSKEIISRIRLSD